MVALGLFSVPGPEVFNDVVSLMAGAAALGGMSAATGEAVDRTIRFLPSGTPKRPPGMPHHLRVRSHRFYRGAGAVPELPDPLRLTSRHQLLDGRRRGHAQLRRHRGGR